MDRKVTLQFLETLFPEIPESSSILIWTLAGKRSAFATSREDAVTAASSAKGDVYVGCCLAPLGIAGGGRASADQVTRMTSLWADVDYVHSVHQKKHLPPDEKSALQLIRKMPFKPTMIVHTGHGLQPWWMLNEPIDLHDNASKQQAAALSKAWNRLLQRHAKSSGWSVDSTWDLARIMRLPGTANCKGKGSKPVVLHSFDPTLAVSIQDIEEYLPIDVEEIDLLKAPVHENLQFGLNPDAEPPFGKFDAALTNDDMFAETWNQERKFESMSEYDLSLASQLSAMGWTDQEIIDTMIAFRRKYHGKPKLRIDYYRMTLQKAKREADESEADERICEIAALSQMDEAPCNSAKVMDNQSPKDARRVEAIKNLGQWFGFKVLTIEKTRSEEPLYTIRTERGSIKLGPVSSISRQQKFREGVLDATGQWIKTKSKKLWNSYIQVIADACEEIDVGPEATDEGASHEWLHIYLDANPPIDLDIEGDSQDFDLPAYRTIDSERLLLIGGPHFRTWLREANNGPKERFNRKELGMLMRAGGAMGRSVRLGKSTVHKWAFKKGLSR